MPLEPNDYPLVMETDGTPQFTIKTAQGRTLFSCTMHTDTIIDGQQTVRRVLDCANALAGHEFTEMTTGVGRVTAELIKP